MLEAIKGKVQKQVSKDVNHQDAIKTMAKNILEGFKHSGKGNVEDLILQLVQRNKPDN